MSRCLKYMLVALLMSVSTTAYAQMYPERQHVRKGNSLYESQRMEEAQRSYRNALQLDSLSVEGTFNLGDAQFAMGDFVTAENTFKNLLENKRLTDEQKAKTYYNLGNSLFQQQKLQEALDSYKSSLKLNPQDMEAKFNYAYTKKLLEQQNEDQNQQQQQNQNNQNNQNQQGDDNKEGEGQEQPQDGQNQPQPQEPEGDKPEPNEEPEGGEQPQPRPESEQMLNAVQAAEDKTREKVDAEKVVGVARSGKNW